ncbi:putative ubiquinol--cytochrome-c reductase [Tilletiopsis washingtonensis]|uniref:Cytochrome b-c1 complex subunit 7 n=1 Tax=Tilletiopsis washingtonensis TaxID=58919 RepID=A0A316ZGY5_9BASI|nr:putative ubiquinol--cytochrome-c reductase [Tilletiopsis washingtonensis]PWO00740.1 putative ubiquinol--cytochrome-c reductase [Tilletiopsis washingtonensis]
MAPLDGFSLFRFIKSSPNLLRSLQPISNAYANAAGHRKVGLKYDDLIIEEDGKVQKALSRLSERESYDRAARLRAAFQYSVLHRDAPKEQWLSAEDDKRYLTPKIEEIESQEKERSDWDTVKVSKN